ncbi:MAG: helix-turn-helix domain-containing protein [Candidatus Dormibacteraeota bacterium]|nr:helix-turn-helix domain-containing protein [Candidatus Dormibacteraeota bacterium]
MDLLQALADPTRRRILNSLQAAGSPATVDEIAAAQGIHRTVAFDHLEVLAGQGLLVRGSRTGLRGRPARTYRSSGEAVEVSYPRRQHRLLAGLLAGAVARGTEPRRAGETLGRDLAAGSSGEAGALTRLEPLGARYAVVGGEIHARNCIFREACDAAREVVCGVQAGVLQGALAAAGVDREVTPRGPEAGGGCRYEVRGAPS